MANERAYEELTELMDLLDVQLRVEMPRELLEGLDNKVNKLAARLGEDPDRWDAALHVTYEVVSMLILAKQMETEPGNYDMATLTLIAIYIGRFLAHPMCRPIIKRWGEEEA